jgi:hypothetical protein
LRNEFKKRKKGKMVFGHFLVEYFDLVWCFHNDFRRVFVFCDNADDADGFAQVVGLWRIGESWKIAGKDYGSEVVVVCVKIEEAYDTCVVGVDDCAFNNDVLIVVAVSIIPGYDRKIGIPGDLGTRLKDIVTP